MTKRPGSIPGPWVPHRLDMIQSPSWRSRPAPLANIMERLEIEHMRHAGTSNGQLYVSYGQFVEFGVSRRAIKAALRLGEQLGLLEVMESPGLYGGTIRSPQAYRLTYLATPTKPPSDEWKHISQTQAGKFVQAYHQRVK